MNNRFIRKTLLIAGVLLLTLGISWQPALAKGKKKRVLIKKVHFDSENNLLIISGENFDNKNFPVVTCGDSELTVVDYSAEEIRAELYEELEGDYLLTVKTGRKNKHFDSYGLTSSLENVYTKAEVNALFEDLRHLILHNGFMWVSAGDFHTCGVSFVGGTVECWGNNDYGQSSPPAGIFTQVAGGAYHTCGLRSDGTVECWGDNTDGQSDPPP